MSLKWMQIAGGSNHSVVVTDGGDAYAFGDGSDGQLGNGTYEDALAKYKKLPSTSQNVPAAPSSHSPVQVLDLGARIVHVAAGSRNSACLDADGKVYTWGYAGIEPEHPLDRFSVQHSSNDDTYKEQHNVTRLGLGPPDLLVAGDVAGLRVSESEWKKSTHTRPRLVIISIDSPIIKTLACGSDHTLALSRDGDAYSWGLGEFGQLGHGNILNEARPKMIDSLCGMGTSDVACGSKHSVVVTVTGEAMSFGFGGNGRLGNGWLQGTLLPSLVQFRGVGNNKKVHPLQVDDGESHTAFVTTEGVAYTCGK